MSLSSKIGQVLSGKALCDKVREARRRQTLKETTRRRLFEALEPRQMLDAASLYETLPDVITLADSDSYHYAIEGLPNEFVDESSIDGLTASFVGGDQVAFTIQKTATDGAVSTLGEVVIQLFSEDAPNSTSQFVSLVMDDYYEGKTFHRVIPGFMFQGGSSDGYGFEGSGTSVADEYSDVLTHSGRGVVAFANSNNAQYGRFDTSDAQFYITFDQCSWLDGGYNVFGFVVDGYDVIDQMETVETTTVDNPVGSKSENFPIDTYTIRDVRYIAHDDASQSAMRLVAEDGASGVTTLSFTSNLSGDALKFQETTVYVGEDGLQAYVENALNETNFEFVAGSTVDVSLPTEFGGYAIQYTIAHAVEPQGYRIEAADASNSNFTIVSDESGAQYTTLTFDAALANGMTASVSVPMYISPAKPNVSLESTAETKVGDLEGGVKIISSDLAESALDILVTFKGFDLGATTEEPLCVYVDGTEYAYNVSTHTYDEETETHSYRLRLQLRDGQALSDGMHSVAVSQYVTAYRDGAFTRLYSELVSYDVYVDTEALSFTEPQKTIDLKPGDTGVVQLHTNKADDEGVERSDIKFELSNPDAGPRFITLSETGALGWSNVTTDDYGVYFVGIKATDALGNVGTMKLTLNVGSVPVFDEVLPVETKTGESVDVDVIARVPGAEGVEIKYELVGDDLPEGVAINETTGKLTWAIPEDYIENTAVKTLKLDIAVQATALLPQDDGTFVEGDSATQTVAFWIENSLYDETTAEVPVWVPIPTTTVETGEKFQLGVVADVPEDYGVEYKLVNAPQGMTIDEDGQIEWDVPEDYFGSDKVKSTDITISLSATAIVSASESGAIEYGESAGATFSLTIENAKFVDYAPEFADLPDSEATTGETFSTIISATDPNGLADRISLELVGDYPDSIAFDAETGELTWEIPSGYLASNVVYRKVLVSVKGTEQFLGEDGVYTDGLSATKEYVVLVANAAADEDKIVTPEWTAIDAQTVKPGDSLDVKLSAKATGKSSEEDPSDIGGDVPQEDYEYDVEYALKGDFPEGMKIVGGKLQWDVPENYFEGRNVKSETLTIELDATTIMDNKDVKNVDYGGTASTTFELTIDNPDYVDCAPVFEELESTIASTGSTYTATIVATDPEGEAEIRYELVAHDYPDAFQFDAATGVVTWAIPADYLPTDVSAQFFDFTIKATEQYLQEDGSYVDGLSTEKTFELMVANAAYDPESSVTPTIEAIEAVTVRTGETLTVAVEASASKEIEKPETGEKTTKTYEVEYSLGEGAPEGMTIDSATGVITWNVPEDYFDSVSIESEKLDITVSVKTIVARGETAVNYGGAATTTFEVTVENAKYSPSEYSDWQEWFDAWVANAQAKNEGHSANLSAYLNSYLEAVDARQASLAAAKASYSEGKSTLTEFLQAREQVMNDYNDAISDARAKLAEDDAKVETEYQENLAKLNAAYDKLAADTTLAQPSTDIKADAQEAAQNAVKKDVETATGSSNFRLSNNATGAKVATDLTSVLKLWREGYSYSTVYDEVFSDKIFAETAGEETTDDEQGEGEQGEQIADDEQGEGEQSEQIADDEQGEQGEQIADDEQGEGEQGEQIADVEENDEDEVVVNDENKDDETTV